MLWLQFLHTLCTTIIITLICQISLLKGIYDLHLKNVIVRVFAEFYFINVNAILKSLVGSSLDWLPPRSCFVNTITMVYIRNSKDSIHTVLWTIGLKANLLLFIIIRATFYVVYDEDKACLCPPGSIWLLIMQCQCNPLAPNVIHPCLGEWTGGGDVTERNIYIERVSRRERKRERISSRGRESKWAI